VLLSYGPEVRDEATGSADPVALLALSGTLTFQPQPPRMLPGLPTR
jgi:hypothetical protein